MTSWQRTGNLLVEKVDIRQVNLPIEDGTRLALSPFGGPIATFNNADRTTRVYTSGGKWLASYQLPWGTCEGGIGWTEDLALVFVCDDSEGSVFLWDDFVGLKPRRLHAKFGTPIRMATIWKRSIVALTQKMGVVVMSDLRRRPHIKWSPVVYPVVNPPRYICVLRPETSVDSSLEIAAALADQAGMLVACPERKSVDARVPQFRALPSRLLSPHPTEPILASLDVNDRLLVVNFSWEEVLFARDCQLELGFESIPCSLNWCLGGAGYCVTILWEETPWSQELPNSTLKDDDSEEEPASFGPGGLVLGFMPPSLSSHASSSKLPESSTSIDAASQSSMVARFSFDTSKCKVVAVSEIDGVRVFCSKTKKMHLIRRVSRSTQAVDAIGSLAPAAMLLETLEDEFTLSSMPEDDLIAAADDLMDCAKFEPDLSRRLELLKAAQAAKDRLEDESKYENKARLSRKFCDVCSLIRAVQFLSETQLTSATVIEAIALGLHTFASRIAYLGFPREAKAFARICKLPTQAFDLIEARMAAFIALSKNPPNMLITSNSSADISSARAASAMSMMTKALFHSDSFVRTDCAASLGLVVALQQSGGDATAVAASKEVLLRLAEMESRFSRKLIVLLQMQEVERVLTLLDTSRGVDFDLKSRAALHCLSRAVTPAQEEKIAQHMIAEQAIRASLKSMGHVERLEKWLITVTRLRDHHRGKAPKALFDRAMLLTETAMFSSELTVDKQKKTILLQEAAKEFESAGKTFFATQAKDYMDFLGTLDELGIVTTSSNRSVVHMIQDCVARGRDDLAERLRKRFRVEPHLYWRARIRGMGRRGVWVEAARLVTLQKEVGRWVKVEDVLEMCFDAGADAQASRIAFEVLDDTNPEKARAFVRLRLWKEALSSASKSRCVDALEDISYRCREAEISNKATELLEDIRRNPTASGGEGGAGSSLLGMVAGAVKVEPQRCQQQ